jgi:hypothetical protein
MIPGALPLFSLWNIVSPLLPLLFSFIDSHRRKSLIFHPALPPVLPISIHA